MTAQYGDPNREFGIPGIDDQVAGSAAQQAGIASNRGGGDDRESAAAAKAAGGTAINWNDPKSIVEAWKRGGAMDYNAMVWAGIPGYQGTNGETSRAMLQQNGIGNPFYGQNDLSADVLAARKNAPSPTGGYKNYYDWFQAMSNGGNGTVGMGDVRKDESSVTTHDNPLAGSTGGDTSKAAGLARLMQLWGNPQAATNEVLSRMGMGEYNTGPLASFMRSKAGMLKPAYYLAQGGNNEGMNNPEDYLKFAQNFLGSAGGNLGNVQSTIKSALGAGGPGTQSEGWKELLSGVNPSNGQPWLTDQERSDWMQNMYQIANMGKFNPMQGYMAARFDREPQRFAQEYGSGRMDEKTDFMDYIRGKLPSLFGW